ncbi:dephospho-CoA kinase [Antrihabitans cavernicola]|uniref:Dephospho-CoA kinase n=1 Tax=Antrihabitans cavernicola TaxID=2495913 RepID=A0A5A7S4H1_9NOCA|nr:dephospho-CoA kinase [Spelaeibacter cavernicola]
MLRIGLTGGMGAGKSTVSKVLAQLGAVIVDADAIAREVVEPGTPGLASLVTAFGDDLLRPDGTLDRAALAAKAFADPESTKKLNAIVHPLVGARTAELIDGAPADAIVVQDIPLLVEGKLGAFFNLVIVVWVDAEERVRRLVEFRDIPESDARARIAAQATDDQRRAAADVWLDNSGEPGSLDSVVRKLWDERLVPFERNVRERIASQYLPEIVPANHEWPAQAARLVARLRAVCGDKVTRIDHVGSTAAGTEAQDVIELQITTANQEAAKQLVEPLAAAGFPQIEAGNYGSADPGRPANVDVRVGE